jgi:hypothetical protein
MAPSFSLLADITGQSHGGDFAEGDELHADKVEFTQDTIFLQEKDRIELVLRHCPWTLAVFCSNLAMDSTTGWRGVSGTSDHAGAAMPNR